MADGASHLSRYREVPSYLTKDGSTIRELMHPVSHGNHMQSLAEARIAPGATTLLHRHLRSEELYHVTAGSGIMTLGAEHFAIGEGDSVAIAPGVAHRVENSGTIELVILCCCSPPYAHEDTELLAR